MGYFDDSILKDSESLFIKKENLDFNYIPTEVPYRENQKQEIANCIKPLFRDVGGRNLFITGSPGIGKTCAVLHLFEDLKSKTDEVIPIYINCWKKDTAYKIVKEICEQIDYKWTSNKTTEELIKIISNILNKKSTVICLDEIDKLKEDNILYNFSEDLFKKTLILIANDASWISNLENRIRSRLNCGYLEFKPYNYNETMGILKRRIESAFVPGVFNPNSIELVSEKTHEVGDIRFGLDLLRNSGDLAEAKSSKKIELDDIKEAITKSSEFKIKKVSEFKDEDQFILKLIKENSGKTIRALFEIYQKNNGEKAYRSFHRIIQNLNSNKMIEVKTKEGSPSIVNYTKKLDDF